MAAQGNQIVVKFEVRNMSAPTYDEVLRRLEDVGAGAPPGRLFHIASGSRESLQVIDLYDAPESFESFGRTLVPILQELGIEARPDVQPVYNTIEALAGSAV
jgi:hypothetical protein